MTVEQKRILMEEAPESFFEVYNPTELEISELRNYFPHRRVVDEGDHMYNCKPLQQNWIERNVE